MPALACTLIALVTAVTALALHARGAPLQSPPAAAQSPAATQPAKAHPPSVGEQAIAFELTTLDTPAQTVALDLLRKAGPVVLVVLRGWPGYQCPICSRQVLDLRKHADDFARAGATVVMVYPGPADDLKAHAAEFIHDSSLPDNFRFVIDPDYGFTNAWHLRWDAPKETAYPSTFVIDRDNVVRYQMVSTSHGGRANAEDVVKALDSLSSD